MCHETLRKNDIYGRAQGDGLAQRLLKLEGGISAQHTFNLVFRIVDLRTFTGAFRPVLEGIVAASARIGRRYRAIDARPGTRRIHSNALVTEKGGNVEDFLSHLREH
ncbi:hypothetical protein [Aromatoleum buckelii]|uniref:Uncharacterized protein n=1 Tax=Aromatoleum buckelii TaxID=200254 RepID=A0ABX1N364_9RHOO|nr:hypothetical protein [Aromatoleum buckelii]MCK0513170.1 hypothetical protein [Aromatoleum buckelii]